MVKEVETGINCMFLHGFHKYGLLATTYLYLHGQLRVQSERNMYSFKTETVFNESHLFDSLCFF